MSTSFELTAVHEGYYFQFDYLYKLSYLMSNDFSWYYDNCSLRSSSRISACIWKMKISEQNDARKNIN